MDEDETSFTKKDLDFYNIHSLLELSTTVNLAQAMAQTEYSFALATQQSINQARNYSDVADEEKELRAMQKRLTDVDWNLLAYKKPRCDLELMKRGKGYLETSGLLEELLRGYGRNSESICRPPPSEIWRVAILGSLTRQFPLR